MPLKPLKTRDWGSQFSGVVSHLADKAAATSAHNLALQNEISTHQGHAYGRHGYQTGWVAQLIRVVTQISPDQSFSPTGVEGVIREWNARWVGSDSGAFSKIVNTYDASGNSQKGVAAGSGFTPTGHGTQAGLESGGFISPEKQQMAIQRAMTVANPNIVYMKSEHPGIAHPWKDINRCMVVVDAGGSAGYGVGYRRTSSFVSRTRQEVLDLVEAMELGKTRGQLGLPDTGAPTTTSDGRKLRPESQRPAFNGVASLLDFLGVEAVWQKMALVILQRDGAAWKRVTMYPCNLVGQGWAPGIKVQGKPWSGRVKRADGSMATLPVPVWTPQ